MIGYVFDSKGWQIIIQTKIPRISYKNAFISNGKFLLTKYIPGKVWVITGRAGYLKERYHDNFLDLTSYSLYHQILVLFAGTMIGIGAFFNTRFIWFGTSLLALIIVMGFLFQFKDAILKILGNLLSRLIKKEIKLPEVSTRRSISVLLNSSLSWLFFAVGFSLLISSLYNIRISLEYGLLFPLSIVFGTIALFAPSGIGIREGFLTFALTSFGISTAEAVSISIVSRLWFLIGEVLFFIMSISFEFLQNKLK